MPPMKRALFAAIVRPGARRHGRPARPAAGLRGPRHRRGRRHRRLQGAQPGRQDREPARAHRRHGLHARRQRLRERHAQAVRRLLRPDLGPLQGAHAAGRGQPRVRHRVRRAATSATSARAAGDPTKGYYSYDLGTWHLIVINSNCAQVGGCHAGSPQEQWLRQDLAAHPAPCTVAMWHHPRYLLGRARGRPVHARHLAGALRRQRRRRALGPRPRLRALRPAGRRRQGGPGAGHPPVRRRHRRPRALQVGAQGHATARSRTTRPSAS